MTRIIYADPGLHDNVGHHVNACRSIVGELRTRGIPTRVLAFAEVDPKIQSELGAVPFFRHHAYLLSDGDPIAGPLQAFYVGAYITREDFNRIADLGPDDVLFLPWALAPQFWAAALWLKTLESERAPLVVCNFLHVPEVAYEQSGSDTHWTLPDYRIDPSLMFLRFAAKQVTAAVGSRLALTHSNTAGVSMLRALFGLNVERLPPPQHATTNCRDRGGKRPIVVGIVGHQRSRAKGFHHTPALLSGLLKSHPDIRFLVHSGGDHLPPDLEQDLKRLAAEDRRISLHLGPVGPDEWSALLDRIDLVLCPYSSAWYRLGTSGIHNEAIANGIPSVVPANTTLAAAATEFCGSSVMFDTAEPESMLSATRYALDNFDRYAEAVKQGSAKWRDFNGPGKLVDALLAMVQRHRLY